MSQSALTRRERRTCPAHRYIDNNTTTVLQPVVRKRDSRTIIEMITFNNTMVSTDNISNVERPCMSICNAIYNHTKETNTILLMTGVKVRPLCLSIYEASDRWYYFDRTYNFLYCSQCKNWNLSKINTSVCFRTLKSNKAFSDLATT